MTRLCEVKYACEVGTGETATVQAVTTPAMAHAVVSVEALVELLDHPAPNRTKDSLISPGSEKGDMLWVPLTAVRWL